MPSVPAGESAGEDCQCDQDGNYNRPHTTISCLLTDQKFSPIIPAKLSLQVTETVSKFYDNNMIETNLRDLSLVFYMTSPCLCSECDWHIQLSQIVSFLTSQT